MNKTQRLGWAQIRTFGHRVHYTINTEGHVSYTELLAQNDFFFWYFIISVPEKKNHSCTI